MYKFTIIATLLTVSATGFANTALPTPTIEETKNYTSVRNLPVIVQNEQIAQDTCRLSFESGMTKDVPCSPYSEAKTVAIATPTQALKESVESAAQ